MKRWTFYALSAILHSFKNWLCILFFNSIRFISQISMEIVREIFEFLWSSVGIKDFCGADKSKIYEMRKLVKNPSIFVYCWRCGAEKSVKAKICMQFSLLLTLIQRTKDHSKCRLFPSTSNRNYELIINNEPSKPVRTPSDIINLKQYNSELKMALFSIWQRTFIAHIEQLNSQAHRIEHTIAMVLQRKMTSFAFWVFPLVAFVNISPTHIYPFQCPFVVQHSAWIMYLLFLY